MKRLLSVGGLSVAMFLTVCLGQARATTVLLDLEDPPTQSDSPFTLTLIATATTTDVTFAGYQLPDSEIVSDIRLTSGGGSNLLGPNWDFTPAPCGSLAFELGPGAFGTNDLFFAGTCEDSFDQFSQTVSTVIGQHYTLRFLFTNSDPNAPSELLVTTSGAAVPEPASLTLLGSGLVALAARRRSRKTARA
jgi:hypothetical protein